MTSTLTNSTDRASSSDRDRAALIEELRARARRKVRARTGLNWHALVFAMVNVALFAINRAYTPTVLWFVWPLGAWGAALALHAFAVLNRPGATEDAIEAEVQRELARRGLT